MEVFLSFEKTEQSGDSATRRMYFGVFNCNRWISFLRDTSGDSRRPFEPIRSQVRHFALPFPGRHSERSEESLLAGLAAKEPRHNRWLDVFVSCGLV